MIRVAVAQLRLPVGRPEQNREVCLDAARVAAESGADIVVLPELSNSGYALATRHEALESAEAVPGGPTTVAWREIAARTGAYICGGILEQDGFALHNSAALVGPEGFIGVYRKTHLYETERLLFEPGEPELTVHQLPFGRVSMMICYDAWHWEIAKILKLQGADLVLNPTCWTRFATVPWQSLPTTIAMHIGLAHSTRVFIANASHCGEDRGRQYLGCSCIAGPEGLVTPAAGVAEPETVYADIDLASARDHRWLHLSDMFGDRRLDIYDRTLGYRTPRLEGRGRRLNNIPPVAGHDNGGECA